MEIVEVCVPQPQNREEYHNNTITHNWQFVKNEVFATVNGVIYRETMWECTKCKIRHLEPPNEFPMYSSKSCAMRFLERALK